MENDSAHQRAVIIVDDTTTRGYAKLALLYANVVVNPIAVADVANDVSAIAEDVIIIDATAHAALAAAVAGDESLARRVILLDPRGAVGDEQREGLFAVLDRLDAERLVRTVHDCLAAHATPREEEPDAPAPAATAEVAEASAPSPVAAAVAPLKKAIKKIAPKKNAKPKRRR